MTARPHEPGVEHRMWALMAPRGEKGQKGDAGPNNLYWARLAADGTSAQPPLSTVAPPAVASKA